MITLRRNKSAWPGGDSYGGSQFLFIANIFRSSSGPEAAYIATGKRTLLGVTRTLWHEIDELMRDASRLHAIPAEKFPSP